jgi:hypothetical protein
MEREFIIAGFITLLFSVFKFIEIRFLDEDTQPLKFFVRDAVKVFLASLLCSFVFIQWNSHITDFLNTVTNNAIQINEHVVPVIFTDEPGF